MHKGWMETSRGLLARKKNVTSSENLSFKIANKLFPISGPCKLNPLLCNPFLYTFS